MGNQPSRRSATTAANADKACFGWCRGETASTKGQRTSLWPKSAHGGATTHEINVCINKSRIPSINPPMPHRHGARKQSPNDRGAMPSHAQANANQGTRRCDAGRKRRTLTKLSLAPRVSQSYTRGLMPAPVAQHKWRNTNAQTVVQNALVSRNPERPIAHARRCIACACGSPHVAWPTPPTQAHHFYTSTHGFRLAFAHWPASLTCNSRQCCCHNM